MNATHDKSPADLASAADAASGLPPESVRTIVTLVLLFHLFIATLAAFGSARAYSELVSRLVDKLVGQTYYPDLLALRSFSYGLTYNLDSDYEGGADIVLGWEDGDEAQNDRVEAKDKLVLFDPEEVRLPIRRQRYLSFLRRMGDLATTEPPSPLEVEMPMAVSRVLLERADMPTGRHRFRLRRFPTRAPDYLDDPRTPPIMAVYEGNITVRDGRFEFTKADRAAASSPVVPAGGPTAPGGAANGLPPLDALPLGAPRLDSPTGGLPLDASPLVPPIDNPARANGNR